MEEKKDIRYNTKLVLIFITIASLLGVVVGNLFNTDIFKGDYDNNYKNERISQIININVRNSLYRQNIEFSYIDPLESDDIVKTFVRSYKISNYPFTEQYKKLYPDNIVLVDSGGKYNFFSDEEEVKSFMENNSESFLSNKNITEEPKYKLSHLTNTGIMSEFDPQNIPREYYDDVNEGIIVSGFFENGNLNINPIEFIGENENNKNYSRIFLNAIKNVYDNIDTKENGIKKINFLYVFNIGSEQLQKELDLVERSILVEDEFTPRLVIGILSTIFLVAVLASVSNYNKMKNVSIYNSIEAFPVEVVLFLIFIWCMPATAITWIYSKGLNDLWVNGIKFILGFSISFAAIYIIYGLKSIYNEKLKSFVIKKSIILNLVNGAKRIALKEMNKASITKKNNVIVAYVVMLILGFLASNIVVRRGLEIPVFILWFILVTLIFNYFKGLYNDLRTVENVTEKISSGDYDVKIDEYETSLHDIAKNINSIGGNLNNAVEKAIKSERLKTELITNVSHDLKTPLTSIINYSELMIDKNSTNEQKTEYAKIINEKSHKLKSLIEDLFEVSRVTSMDIDLKYETIDFRALIEQIVGEWDDKLEEKDLKINMNMPEKAVLLDLDGNKTSRVLDNIFSNIYKYALENTRVYLDLSENDESIKLTIKNISKYELNISSDELLERFTRGDESRNTEGSGLGLSIASSLTEAQKGMFDIEIDGDLFKIIIEFNK